ncbi:MAG: PBP1A family penicillin-binding protein [Acidobacteriaceae bacterium]|nr:PBP1A family penicillin-binding protein [Acidobacteriaceae bacterium]
MAIKIKIPNTSHSGKAGGRSFSGDPVVRIALLLFVILGIGISAWFSYYYIKYDRIIEQRFRGQVFSSSARIYARPKSVEVGEAATAREIAAQLQRAGYSSDASSALGTYRLVNGGIEIKPGAQSYHSPEPATIRIQDGKVTSISGKSGPLQAYGLEPQIVTAFDVEQRAKRQVVKYDQIPKVMIDAVLAIEDRRFFQHGGVNFVRMAEAAWIDFWHERHEQGGSTLTMQLSRGFFLTPQKTIRRKLTEMLIAEEMEQKFSKQQIFEFYGNWVDLGQRGSFTISGFAQAARAYFDKDLKDISLPEAALLAGIIQRPSYLSPYRHPERALERRNVVLDSMVETHAITRAEADKAKATPLKLAPPNVEASDAPYFVDLVRDSLISKFSERELNEQSYRIYTTLDPDLQRAAAHAVDAGMKLVDEQVTKRRTKRIKIAKGKYETKVEPGPQAQVALVAIDPHTGEVLALVGGRNYGFSQLDHAVAKRPTGSIFKPFVYAAAINTGVNGANPVFTPASMVDDQPSTFAYGDSIYEPRNYKEEYHGEVTARYALAMSLNNATVQLAQEVGYDKVADLAKAAGITSVKATPAMALGAYDATPLEMAAAYTVFANGGTRISPILLNSVRNAEGDVVTEMKPDHRDVLDPRVAYVMTDMMESVINNGLGFSAVRGRGFEAPAAGKTGSSHDGWFAGYTSNILCVVWVGFDDYSDLHLSGAQTAAPIWADFMKSASALPQYADMQPFSQPTGVVDVQLDKSTNLLATPACPETYTAAFITGTEPTTTCDQSNGIKGFFSRILGIGNEKPLPPPGANATTQPGTQAPAGQDTADDGKKKKGFFGKIAGIFKDDKPSNPPPKPPAENTNSPQ